MIDLLFPCSTILPLQRSVMIKSKHKVAISRADGLTWNDGLILTKTIAQTIVLLEARRVVVLLPHSFFIVRVFFRYKGCVLDSSSFCIRKAVHLICTVKEELYE